MNVDDRARQTVKHQLQPSCHCGKAYCIRTNLKNNTSLAVIINPYLHEPIYILGTIFASSKRNPNKVLRQQHDQIQHSSTTVPANLPRQRNPKRGRDPRKRLLLILIIIKLPSTNVALELEVQLGAFAVNFASLFRPRWRPFFEDCVLHNRVDI